MALNPDDIERLADRINEIYEPLNDAILKDVVRRIQETDYTVTATAQWQIEVLKQWGITEKQIKKQIAAALALSEKELRKIFKEAAGMMGETADAETWKPSKHAVNVLNASMQKTNNTLKNLTGTTVNNVHRTFLNVMDKVHDEVISGAFSYNSSIYYATMAALKDGARVTYPTGHRDHIDVAARRAVLTGVSQTSAKIEEIRCKEIGEDLVQVSAHIGARPEHAVWQGSICSLSGESKRYPSLTEYTGYGTGAGLCGWNCRHSFTAYHEGMPRAWSKETLEEYANAKVTYNRKEMSLYDATQKQRYFERDIRQKKRELAGLNEIQKDNPRARAAFVETSKKLKAREKELDGFLEQTGLMRYKERERVVGFGRSVSQKAVWANKKELEKYTKLLYNKDGTIKVTGDWTNRKNVSIPSQYKPFAVIDVKTKRGEINRSIYDEASRLQKQINPTNHGNAKKHPYGKNGEHVHDIIWDEDRIIDRPARELTEEERKEHKDIL